MAPRSLVWPSRAFTRQVQQCHVCYCFADLAAPRKLVRRLTTASSPTNESQQSTRPRWSYTPAAMKAPFPVQARDPSKAFKCNSDPEKLEAVYTRLFGRDGRDILTEEVKWLAVTHKSFDQGRRGFNDRLAYFGKRIVLLQTMLSLFHSPLATATQMAPVLDPHSRQPFQHKDLEGLQNLTNINTSQILSKERLGALASSYGIGNVTRWKPKNPANLSGSGKDVVYASSLYAIVGAVALQKGGAAAVEFAREKILNPLGIQ